MRKTLLSTLAVAVLLGASGICPAQEKTTLVTVAFSGYDEIRADLDFLGKLGGNPGLAQGMEGLLTLMTQGKGLAGLDKSKPWGLVVQTDGQEFPVFGFIPVTDLKALLAVIEKFDIESEEVDGGVLKITKEGQNLYVKEKDGWALIAQSAEGLEDVPDDPVVLLAGLHKKYDIAVRASIKNIPQPIRDMLIEQMKVGTRIGMQQMPGEGDDDYAIRTGMTKKAIDQAVAMINELDELLLGLAVDRNSGTSYLDIDITAQSGTTLAERFAQIVPGKTNFAGFEMPGAAMTAIRVGTLSDADVTQAKSSIADVRTVAIAAIKEEGLSDEELQLATGLINDLLDVLDKSIESKKVDLGMVLTLEPGAINFAAGMALAETAKLEKVVKQLAQLAKDDSPEEVKVKINLDAETHNGIRFHVVSVPVPDTEEEVAKLLGETLTVVVGIGDDSAYLAAGSDPLKLLKEAIDKSALEKGKTVPPARVVITVTPIVKMVAETAEDDMVKQMAAMLVGLLEQSSGKDHITMTTKPIPNGASTRIEIEEGILKLIGQAGQMAGATPGAVPPGVVPMPIVPEGGATPAPAEDNPF